jgi:putative radical SAM enzyme (TIGR03279 family)
MSRATIQPAPISHVLPDSIAAELGIEPGDRLVSINGEAPRDLIDYQFAIADEVLQLEILDAAGKLHHVELEKDVDADLGLEFTTALFDGLIQCNNACPFCFIDQQPPETRATLHLKDDDYRLSFLYGSYLTLTNLPTPEWDRIARLRLSPLYVSVHATEPEVRSRLLKNPRAALILDHLQWFRRHRLQIHAQVVLCPGWNDGDHLTRTLQDLATFRIPVAPEADEFASPLPTVLSAAVVPVGLTRFRPPDDEITPVTRPQAAHVIDQVQALQQQFQQSFGSVFAWLADEWYLLAERDLPPADHYEDYPQLGNGVGSLRQFLREFAALALPASLPRPLHLTWIVGNAVEHAFQPIVQRLNQIGNLTFEMCSIASQFWGQTLTVTGLLTGQDILSTLSSRSLGDALLLPTVTLKDGERFLDDLSWLDLERILAKPVIRVSGGASGLLQAIKQAADSDPLAPLGKVS